MNVSSTFKTHFFCIFVISFFFKTSIFAITQNQVCTPPVNLILIQASSYSAQIQWSPGDTDPTNTYEWELIVGGAQPGTNSFVLNGTTPDTVLNFVMLDASTEYVFHVRTICGAGKGDWVAQLPFNTLAGCGDVWTDDGGLAGNYPSNQAKSSLICAETTDKTVTVTFTGFQLGLGDTLTIFNGDDFSAPVYGQFTATGSVPTTFTCTTGSGCLLFLFQSDLMDEAAGWQANITCEPPTECYDLQLATVNFTGSENVIAQWYSVFDAALYEWVIGESPYNPLQIPLLSGNTTNTSVNITGLLPSTFYDLYVRAKCVNGGESEWVHLPFFTTPECFNIPEIGCGQIGVLSSNGTGVYNNPICGLPTPGKEKLARFTAPNTRMYEFEVTFVNNGTYVGYFYKPVSEGCGPGGWSCIDDFNQLGSEQFGPLTAGVEYYIMHESQNPNTTVVQFFKINDCEPINDYANNAITLTVDVTCQGNIFSNANGSIQPGEPDPDTDESDGLSGRWLNEIEKTVWFKFTAPESGTVQITTDGTAQGSNYDTQLALYQVIDENDFSTFKLLESDEDSGLQGLGFNAVLVYTGLVPNQDYYIQVDGFGVTFGTFCIEVAETAPRTLVASCTSSNTSTPYHASGLLGNLPGGDRWYGIYTTPDILDLGDIVAAAKPGPLRFDTVYCDVNITSEVPISGNNVYYMPAYYNFQGATGDPDGPLTVRLFFYYSEFDSLKLKANLPAATIDDLVATFYNGPNEDCNQVNNDFVNGTYQFIPDFPAVQLGNGTFFVDIPLPNFGEIGVHLGNVPLPVELAYFKGKTERADNVLEWATNAAVNTKEFVLQRSQNGQTWTDIGTIKARNSNVFETYSFTDKNPLPKSFYRLQSVDFDGFANYSNMVILEHKGLALTIHQVYPSPVEDWANFTIFAPEEAETTLQMVSLHGVVVQQQSLSLAKGQAILPVNLRNLPTGIYFAVFSTESGTSTPIKFVKQ